MVYKLTPLNFFAGLVVGVLIVNFIDLAIRSVPQIINDCYPEFATPDYY
jgi:hypothetical protein